jgi:hypothetical protein
MARSIQEIKQQITDNAELRGFLGLAATDVWDEKVSSVSLINILFYCVSFGLWVLENIFDAHKAEVADYILRMKPHSAAWYVTMAKAFQYGFDLQFDSDKFDNEEHTEEEIEASKIVKYAAAIERGGQLLIKVAKIGANNDLQELSADELAAFVEYINRVRDAGVVVLPLTNPADDLRLQIAVDYNPLILNSIGERIDGTANAPVRDAIRNYLANIEFDGTFITNHLIDAIQRVDGVRYVYPVAVEARYGSLNFEPIIGKYSPLGGYMRITDENMIISY